MHDVDGRVEMGRPTTSPGCKLYLVVCVHALIGVEYDDFSSFHVHRHVALPQVAMAQDGIYLPAL